MQNENGGDGIAAQETGCMAAIELRGKGQREREKGARRRTNGKGEKMIITITIKKSDVYKEVAQTTDYTGAKLTGDESGEAYDRIRTVDGDDSALERPWDECRADVAKAFIRLLVKEDMYGDDNPTTTTVPSATGDYYALILNVSDSWDGEIRDAMLPGMKSGLFSYFVLAITAKWYVYAKKDEAEQYATRAVATLDEVKQKAFYKKAPTRPRYR